MDNIQKQTLKAELSGIRAIISASSGPAAGLNQTNFVVSGPVVIIPGLPGAAQAFRLQAEAMEKLAVLIEKIINAS